MSWITLANTKIFLGISGTSLDDKINLIIPGVQDIIKGIIGDIELNDKTESIDICSINIYGEVYLSNGPITVLKSINGTTYSGTSGVDYKIEGNKITINNIAQYLTNLKFKSVDFVYTAGYSTIPSDIQEIMYTLVGQELNKKEGSIIKSYTLGPRSVTLDNSNGEADGLINSINAILGKYKIFKI